MFDLMCLSMSVHVAFYFKLGFGREGRGFESGSWFFGGSGWCYFIFIKGTFCLLIFFLCFVVELY